MSTKKIPDTNIRYLLFPRIRYIICSVLLAIVFIASTGCNKESPVTSPGGSASYIDGYVTNGSGFSKGTAGAIDAAIVSVGKIQSNGSISIVSTSSTVTDMAGHYIVEVDAVGERNLVVIATKNGTEMKALVSAELTTNSTVTAPPMTVQTTVEADVYAQLAASENVSIVDLRAYIDDVVASDVKGNMSAIVALSSAIGAEAQARAEAFASSEISATADQLERIRNAEIDATASLDAALSASWNNPPGSTAALEIFFQSVIDAHVNNGIDMEEYVRGQVAAIRAMLNWAGGLSAETRLHLEHRAAIVESRLMDHVSQAEFQALNATQAEKNAVLSAGITLKAAISIATTTEQITESFGRYHDAIVQSLSATMSAQADAIISVDADITAGNGFKAQMESHAEAAATTRQVVDAYMSFYHQVQSALVSEISTASDVEVRVISSILVMVNSY